LGPENAVILTQAIRLRRETGDVDGCKAALDQCDAVHPGYAPAYEEMEWVYKAGYENDEPARVAVLRRLDRSKPLGVADEIDIARFLGSRAPFEVCKAHFDRALGRTPAYYPRGLRMLADDVMDAMYCWGGNARTGEQFALDYANRCLTKSIEQHPTFQARRTLARVALLGRHFEDAEKQLKALAEERPEDAQIRKLLADTQRARGEFEAAAVNYEAAEKGSTYRGWDAVLLYAGRLQCLALTDPEKARATLAADLAEAQQKGSPPEAYPLQVYYLAAQQFDEVEKVADEAKARGDVEWPVWLNVGLAHMGRGNWQGALQAFEAARALPGADVRLKVATMVCDWKLGKAQEARRVWGEVEAADFRWLTVARLRENLWPPVAVEAFKELKAAQALPDQ
jgi:tetratricopeptide (TPR) repeat protein